MRLAAVLAILVVAGCSGSSPEAASSRGDEQTDSSTVGDQGAAKPDSNSDPLEADSLEPAMDGTTPDVVSATDGGVVTDDANDGGFADADDATDGDSAPDAGDLGIEAAADAGPTIDAVAETGPTTVTTPFIVLAGSAAPGIGDYSDGGWDVLNARVGSSQSVIGGRKLLGKTKWGTWSATIKLDSSSLSCTTGLGVGLGWQAVDPATKTYKKFSASKMLDVSYSTSSITVTVGGSFDRGPEPDPETGASYSEITLSVNRIGDGCGTVYAKPSSFTFTQL